MSQPRPERSARSCVRSPRSRAHVIGSAGGADKGAFLKEIGVDHVIDYKTAGNLAEAVLRAAPNGLDVYFDNVGGEHLEAALTAANRFARFALCGMISQGNVAGMPAGPRNIMLAVGKSIRLEGFIVSNHFNLLPEFKRTCRCGYVRQTDVEGNRRAWHRECADGVSRAVHGREFGKDAGEADLKDEASSTPIARH